LKVRFGGEERVPKDVPQVRNGFKQHFRERSSSFYADFREKRMLSLESRLVSSLKAISKPNTWFLWAWANYATQMRWLALTALICFASSLAGAQAPPRNFADCQKAYDAELKRAIPQTNRDLRESQHRAGLVRLRCERAVERKEIQDRAKKR
jgi:hypothetical protein